MNQYEQFMFADKQTSEKIVDAAFDFTTAFREFMLSRHGVEREYWAVILSLGTEAMLAASDAPTTGAFRKRSKEYADFQTSAAHTIIRRLFVKEKQMKIKPLTDFSDLWHKGSERPGRDSKMSVEVLAIINGERHLGYYNPQKGYLWKPGNEAEKYEWDKVQFWAYTEDLMPVNLLEFK